MEIRILPEHLTFTKVLNQVRHLEGAVEYYDRNLSRFHFKAKERALVTFLDFPVDSQEMFIAGVIRVDHKQEIPYIYFREVLSNEVNGKNVFDKNIIYCNEMFLLQRIVDYQTLEKF